MDEWVNKTNLNMQILLQKMRANEGCTKVKKTFWDYAAVDERAEWMSFTAQKN